MLIMFEALFIYLYFRFGAKPSLAVRLIKFLALALVNSLNSMLLIAFLLLLFVLKIY